MVQLLLSSILHRRSMFDPGPFRMEFVVNKMELEQVYLREDRCSSFSINLQAPCVLYIGQTFHYFP